MGNFLLNDETDKLSMVYKVIWKIIEEINDFFENKNQVWENNLNIKGTWGTGKTTVVNNLEPYFNRKFKNKNVSFYVINLWEYETLSNPYNVLLKDIFNKIIKNDLDLKEQKRNIFKITSKSYANFSWQIPLIWLLGIKAKIGTDIKLIEENNNKSLDELNEEAIKELKKYIIKHDLKIVFIFDEIDRCTLKNQIKFLSYVKNIFFKITQVFFIVSCNNEFIDSSLSLKNNFSEKYTSKIFNKSIDLNLVIPIYTGYFTKNIFIMEFIKKISKNEKNVLCAREINDWLEKVDTIFLKLKTTLLKKIVAKNPETLIFAEIKDEIQFIIFFCLYIKNKEKDYYYEIFLTINSNLLEYKNYVSLLDYFFKTINSHIPYDLSESCLKSLINKNYNYINYFSSSKNTNAHIYIKWKDSDRNLYSFNLFSLIPFILPKINTDNINYLFEKNIFKKISDDQDVYDYDLTLNILFTCSDKKNNLLPTFLKLFLTILYEKYKVKNDTSESIVTEKNRKMIMESFNYKEICEIIEQTLFY